MHTQVLSSVGEGELHPPVAREVLFHDEVSLDGLPGVAPPHVGRTGVAPPQLLVPPAFAYGFGVLEEALQAGVFPPSCA